MSGKLVAKKMSKQGGKTKKKAPKRRIRKHNYMNKIKRIIKAKFGSSRGVTDKALFVLDNFFCGVEEKYMRAIQLVQTRKEAKTMGKGVVYSVIDIKNSRYPGRAMEIKLHVDKMLKNIDETKKEKALAAKQAKV